MKRERGKKKRVIEAVMTGYCNTSGDVAEETGLSVRDSSQVVFALIADGVLRDTGRKIHAGYRRRPFTVFEVVP